VQQKTEIIVSHEEITRKDRRDPQHYHARNSILVYFSFNYANMDKPLSELLFANSFNS